MKIELNRKDIEETLKEVIRSKGLKHQIFIDLSDGEVWRKSEPYGSSFITTYHSEDIHHVCTLNSGILPMSIDRFEVFLNYYANEYQRYFHLTLEDWISYYGIT